MKLALLILPLLTLATAGSRCPEIKAPDKNDPLLHLDCTPWCVPSMACGPGYGCVPRPNNEDTWWMWCEPYATTYTTKTTGMTTQTYTIPEHTTYVTNTFFYLKTNVRTFVTAVVVTMHHRSKVARPSPSVSLKGSSSTLRIVQATSTGVFYTSSVAPPSSTTALSSSPAVRTVNSTGVIAGTPIPSASSSGTTPVETVHQPSGHPVLITNGTTSYVVNCTCKHSETHYTTSTANMRRPVVLVTWTTLVTEAVGLRSTTITLPGSKGVGFTTYLGR